MNFFDHKDLGNHLLQLCPKVVKHPVYPLQQCLFGPVFICQTGNFWTLLRTYLRIKLNGLLILKNLRLQVGLLPTRWNCQAQIKCLISAL